jgi:hypothetical protein
MHGKQSGLICIPVGRLRFSLPNKSVIFSKVQLDYNKTTLARLLADLSDVTPLLPIGESMQKKCGPSLIDFIEKAANGSSHRLKGHSLIDTFPESPGDVFIFIDFFRV